MKRRDNLFHIAAKGAFTVDAYMQAVDDGDREACLKHANRLLTAGVVKSAELKSSRLEALVAGTNDDQPNPCHCYNKLLERSKRAVFCSLEAGRRENPFVREYENATMIIVPHHMAYWAEVGQEFQPDVRKRLRRDDSSIINLDFVSYQGRQDQGKLAPAHQSGQRGGAPRASGPQKRGAPSFRPVPPAAKAKASPKTKKIRKAVAKKKSHY